MFDAIGDFFCDVGDAIADGASYVGKIAVQGTDMAFGALNSLIDIFVDSTDEQIELQKKLQNIEKVREKLITIRDYHYRIKKKLEIIISEVESAQKDLREGGHCLNGRVSPEQELNQCVTSGYGYLPILKMQVENNYNNLNNAVAIVEKLKSSITTQINKMK